RRRHTRWPRDWSSDVCSSDLFLATVAYFRVELGRLAVAGLGSIRRRSVRTPDERLAWLLLLSAIPGAVVGAALESTIDEHLGQRSEERRVGKGGRSGMAGRR